MKSSTPKLKGKIALVTGASRGVGRGIATELGAAGATVVITGRSTGSSDSPEGRKETIDETARLVDAAGGKGIPIRCDHTYDEQVAGLFEQIRSRFGRLDLLVNNVWGGYEHYDFDIFGAPFWKQPLDMWSRMFDAGARAHFTASRLAAPLMIDQQTGLIITITFYYPDKYLGNLIYDMSKTASYRMTRGMAKELKEHRVAAVALFPGFVRTERVLESIGDNEEVLSTTQSPEYTGRAVVALASDASIMDKTGFGVHVGDVAHDYGFTDTDGRHLPAFDIPEEYEF